MGRFTRVDTLESPVGMAAVEAADSSDSRTLFLKAHLIKTYFSSPEFEVDGMGAVNHGLIYLPFGVGHIMRIPLRYASDFDLTTEILVNVELRDAHTEKQLINRPYLCRQFSTVQGADLDDEETLAGIYAQCLRKMMKVLKTDVEKALTEIDRPSVKKEPSTT